jgi:hypothetical protein
MASNMLKTLHKILKRKNPLDKSIKIMDRLLDKLDANKLSSAKKQLKNIYI